MKDLIFAPAFGNRPKNLVGRDQLLKQLEECLQSSVGSKERSVVLLGQRGSGKTVLLWEIAEIARKMQYVVATPSIVSVGVLDRIIEKVQDDSRRIMKQEEKRVTGGSIGVLGFSAGIQFDYAEDASKSFGHRITSLARKLTKEGYGLLILIDELQANSEEMRQLIITYQEMVGEGLHVALVMAGLPGPVSSVLNDHVLTFLNRARKIDLEPLKTTDVSAYFKASFAELQIVIPDDETLRAAKKTDGSPYMMQLIGHSMVTFAGEDGALSPEAVKLAYRTAEEEFKQDICQTTLAALSDKDKDFLRAMAEDEDVSGVGDIARRIGASPDYVQIYKRRLLDAGVIEVPSRGKVRCIVPYLMEYMREEL